ncbi:uncharacterized protein VTP21DRAFT_5712 [Calcarisporiella thermophila]|uniref:uncharacterized protein n=1 Tax=Calcarisporiella thermophila TaxID=911321 RepID=UPI0037439079
MSLIELPIIDLGLYLRDKTHPDALKECEKCANVLRDYGTLIVKDPRVGEEDNGNFLDMVEDYFGQPFEAKLPDARPELGYQIGVTPELTEEPKCKRDVHCQNVIEKMPEESRPLAADGPDPKWRFFWRIGSPPPETKFPQLNAPPVIPAAFESKWEPTMNKWGKSMHDAVVGIAEMAAVGFGLEPDTFVKMTKYGPHLLAPTGSDLEKYGEVGTVLAGFHYDLNFLTIHGKSRFPGLHIWPRNGSQKVAVKVPDGCLLVQAGKQMEWLTGSEVMAGYHEVVVTEATKKAIENAKATRPDRPLWRISSTFFLHIASDELLRPLPKFATPEREKAYPAMLTGDYVKAELGAIDLMKE